MVLLGYDKTNGKPTLAMAVNVNDFIQVD